METRLDTAYQFARPSADKRLHFSFSSSHSYRSKNRKRGKTKLDFVYFGFELLVVKEDTKESHTHPKRLNIN
jgi:hypothetical protein